jgi:hypothetical protein
MVYEQLKRDIAEFLFLPGGRFTESTIYSQQKVSRTPVRQALFRLRQEIPYTDFPLTSITLYACWDQEHWVIMLPSEY